jgi:hypothetical protein
MASTVFPAAESGSSVTAQAISTTTANVQKQVLQTFDPGVYEISVSPATSTAIVQFISGSTWIGQTTTASGIINYNLASAADRVYIQSNNVSDVVTVNLVASVPVSSAISGTLDTITTSGTYTQTGKLWVLAIGGGGGGASARNGYGAGGAGGLSGGLAMFYGDVATSTSVTIGAFGAGGIYQAVGSAGGLTSFGAYAVAKGGNGGGLPSGEPGGVAAGTSSGTVIVAPTSGELTNNFRAIINGTTGGGGNGAAGGGNGTPSGGYGSGIGTGGNSAVGQAGGVGSGYGSGGGGGSANGSVNAYFNGGNGAPGVVYVLRGF